MQLFAVAVVVSLIAVTSAQHDPAQHMAMVHACMAQEMPPPSDMELLKAQQMPATDQGRCFVGCMYEKAGIFKDGVYQREYNLEMMKKILSGHPDLLKKVIAAHEICDKEVDSVITDKCQSGMKIMACLHKNIPKISALPD